MKTALLSTAIAAVLFAGSASAHTINGGTLANNTDSYDVYHTTCFSWGSGVHPVASVGAPGTTEVNGPADHLRFTIRGTGATAKVKLTVGKTSAVTPTETNIQASTTDNTNGDGSATAIDFTAANAAPPGWATAQNLVGGNGDYTLVVSHGGTGTNGYDIILHCQNASNQHTATGSFFPGLEDTTALPTADYDTLINY